LLCCGLLCIQIQSLELAVEDGKKLAEEQVDQLQLSFKDERLSWEKEKEEILARAVAERKQMEERATELSEKLKRTQERLKHFESIIKDPWQLFVEAIQKTFSFQGEDLSVE